MNFFIALGVVFFWLYLVATTVIGLIVAFKASIVLGIISLAVSPSSFVYGVAWEFGKNVPSAIQAWIHFPI